MKSPVRYLIVLSLFVFFSSCRNEAKTLFTEISPSHSHINFRNDIKENKDYNILTYEYLYNGGGVAVGDLNNDGLDAAELSKRYGYKGQAYGTGGLGILGYPYMNSHGYANIPAGNHSLRFFAETIDGANKFTSVGFGGDIDYLKIRLFN